MSPLSVEELFDHLGESQLEQLVAAFYRGVRSDEILSPMYPADDLDGAEYRLKEFLVYRLGGPQRYLTERGHPALRMRHAPFAIDQSARDRWMELMTAAMQEVELPDEIRQTLEPFFDQMATFLINR
ncbi:globin [Gimesia maris]|uniref:Group 2 truncated hemoglobin GlbO n=1 Tax=Gimesia maris TaxID=122 RepID=A0ABX5YTS8_9PLAN|nr:globin [Gimesia maris]HAW31362.1 globin [Planctomycetaceae bacterium]EDL58120.1 hemoglobin-like protein [Gimesia maris DSM 8797]QDU16936.1 Group 2 truncated hemoglobin GlbO [Gimesia maris]QEG18987.1 Group 2 truncated hemoglobin GlbO [Gimesia maris]QGQ28122.1 globin [Gimesia maris]|tara:strand:- start:2045 stop:2425 length:381 start_codon:yes stop_codon:yes gene_type:complete